MSKNEVQKTATKAGQQRVPSPQKVEPVRKPQGRTMLVVVLREKLTLGRTTYRKGDIFECRTPEALLLKQAKYLRDALPSEKATKDAPSANTGISNLPPGTKSKEKEVAQPQTSARATATTTATAPTVAPAANVPATPVSASTQTATGATQPQSAPSASQQGQEQPNRYSRRRESVLAPSSSPPQGSSGTDTPSGR